MCGSSPTRCNVRNGSMAARQLVDRLLSGGYKVRSDTSIARQTQVSRMRDKIGWGLAVLIFLWATVMFVWLLYFKQPPFADTNPANVLRP
jgi:hypothetical protein